MEEETDESEQESDNYPEIQFITAVHAIHPHNGFYKTKLTINGKQIEFIIDSGSPITLIHNSLTKDMKTGEIKKLDNKYVDVNKNEIEFIGTATVEIKETNQKLPITITKRETQPLIGLDWMKEMKIELKLTNDTIKVKRKD